VEGLPRQAGFSPGVPSGRGGVLLPVAHPEHALCHIAAQADPEHSVNYASAVHFAAMHPFRVPRSYTIEGEGGQIVQTPPLSWGGAQVGQQEPGLPF